MFRALHGTAVRPLVRSASAIVVRPYSAGRWEGGTYAEGFIRSRCKIRRGIGRTSQWTTSARATIKPTRSANLQNIGDLTMGSPYHLRRM